MERSSNSLKDSKGSRLSKKSEETKGGQQTESNLDSNVRSFKEDEENQQRESEYQESNAGTDQQSDVNKEKESSDSNTENEDDDDDDEESYDSDSGSEENLNEGEEVDTKNLLKHNFGNTDKNFLSEGNSSLKQTQLSKTSRKKTGLVVATRAIYMNTTVNMPVICKLTRQPYLRHYRHCHRRRSCRVSLPPLQQHYPA